MMTFNLHINRTICLMGVFLLCSGFSLLPELDNFVGEKVVSVKLDENKISAHIQYKYKKDASRLSLRHIAKGAEFKELAPSVPSEVMDEIYESLVALHLSGISETKTVLKEHKIETYPFPVVDKFQVKYNNTVKWAKPLRLGDDMTDNGRINNMLEEYGLRIDLHQKWDDSNNLFHVKANDFINIAAIADSFQKVEGVKDVIINVPGADGNDIEATRIQNGWRFDFIIKWGQKCMLPVGCENHHVWSFEVKNTKTGTALVKFLEESGADIPDWM